MTRYATKLKPSPKHKPNLLPLWLALIGLGMLLLAGWAALRGSSPAKTGIEVTGAPRLRIQTDTIDRGNVKLGTFVRDDIRVTNVGDQPLRFTQEPYVTLQEGC